MKPNGNHLVSGVDVADDAYSLIPQGNIPDMVKREQRIQSIKADWKLPFTYAEQQVLMQNAKCLDGISDAEWQIIKDWMFAKLPQGEAARQPYSRGKFIEWLPDVYRHAMQWHRKTTKSAAPAKLMQQAVAAQTDEDRAALADFLKSKPTAKPA